MRINDMSNFKSLFGQFHGVTIVSVACFVILNWAAPDVASSQENSIAKTTIILAIIACSFITINNFLKLLFQYLMKRRNS